MRASAALANPAFLKLADLILAAPKESVFLDIHNVIRTVNLTPDHLCNVLGQLGLGEEISLDEVAVMGLKKSQVLYGFNTLADDLEPHGVSHTDHDPNDLFVMFGLTDTPGKALVYLQDIQRQTPQVVER